MEEAGELGREEGGRRGARREGGKVKRERRKIEWFRGRRRKRRGRREGKGREGE